MPIVKGRGSSIKAWKQLHKNLQNKGDMLLEKGDTKTSLHRVLDASFDELGTRKQKIFLRMAVLPNGAVAPEEMLQNLWELDVSGTYRCLAYSVTTVGSFCGDLGCRGYTVSVFLFFSLQLIGWFTVDLMWVRFFEHGTTCIEDRIYHPEQLNKPIHRFSVERV